MFGVLVCYGHVRGPRAVKLKRALNRACRSSLQLKAKGRNRVESASFYTFDFNRGLVPFERHCAFIVSIILEPTPRVLLRIAWHRGNAFSLKPRHGKKTRGERSLMVLAPVLFDKMIRLLVNKHCLRNVYPPRRRNDLPWRNQMRDERVRREGHKSRFTTIGAVVQFIIACRRWGVAKVRSFSSNCT